MPIKRNQEPGHGCPKHNRNLEYIVALRLLANWRPGRRRVGNLARSPKFSRSHTHGVRRATGGKGLPIRTERSARAGSRLMAGSPDRFGNTALQRAVAPVLGIVDGVSRHCAFRFPHEENG
jgi:hypothetical protein